MSTEIMQEFPLFRDMMAEAEARGKRELVRKLLEQRFGPLSQEIIAAIDATDSPTLLTNLALAAGTESLEQLRGRLGLNDSQSNG